jgi:TatD DNase family protein
VNANYHWLDAHTHDLPEDDRVGAVLNIRYPQVPAKLPEWCSLGIHPWDLKEELFKKQLLDLKSLVSENLKTVKAIGETGLDALKGPELKVQVKAFKEQAMMAEEFGKPVIIHCVKRWNEIIQCKLELQPQVPWIIHGFRQNDAIAMSLLKHGFYFSLGAALCNPGKDWTGFFKHIPLDHCLVETDDQRNWSAPQITRAMAQWSGVAEDVLLLHLHSNFQKIFHELT